jgi:uncharacterized protein YeaO (DUF488 family)
MAKFIQMLVQLDVLRREGLAQRLPRYVMYVIMTVHSYRYGSPREGGEGLRIGTARYLPRGIRRGDWQKKGYFDLWVPLLAPEPDYIKKYQSGGMTFAVFSRHYLSRMKQRDSRQVIEILAGVSLFLPVSLGCFCEDESRCHRSLLRKLVGAEAKKKRRVFADVFGCAEELRQFASPVCYAEED